MTDQLQDRLRRLPLRPPGDLASRAMQAASVEPIEEHGPRYLEYVGAIVAVALIVLATLTLASPGAKTVFSNISAGLGS